MPISTSTNLDYLIDGLRLRLGDIDSANYRYLDEWLRTALVASVKELQRWWGSKYLIDNDTYDVSRNTSRTFEFSSPPIIQHRDEEPIIIMASIIIKQGSLENSSWDFVSWKDAEISYSNLESSRSKKDSIEKDYQDLYDILKPPSKRLAKPVKGQLKGYKDNVFERITKY